MMMAEAHQQAAEAIQVRATRHVLHLEARGRAQIASTSHALHNMLLDSIARRKASILSLGRLAHVIVLAAYLCEPQ